MENHRDSIRLSFESDGVLSQSLPSSPHQRVRTYSRKRCMSTSKSSESSLSEHPGTKVLHFDINKGERQVHRGKCLGHRLKGSVVYSGVDIVSGELFAVTASTLICRVTEDHNNEETSSLQHHKKQIASVEQEPNHLHKLHHPNLVQYLDMKYMQDKDNIIIYTLQEFVAGTPCSFFLAKNIPVTIDFLRYLAKGILTALEFLHENNVVHKDLRDSSIYIDYRGVVKVSDYSLDKRLSDIYQANLIAKVEPDFPTSQGREGKKADIYRFGILMLSLLKGSLITDKEKNVEVDPSLQPDLRDFLLKCLSGERTHCSAEQLLEHCFIRIPLDRGLSHPRLDGNKEQNHVEPEEPDMDVHMYLPTFGERGGQEVIAAGGRYDKMPASLRPILKRTSMSNNMLERDRFQERKVRFQDVVEHSQRQTENIVPITLNRSESKLSTSGKMNTSLNTPANVKINFILSDRDKISESSRRSYKNTMLAKMFSFIQKIRDDFPIEVFAVFLEITVVMDIACYLYIDHDDLVFQKSVQLIIKEHPRHKKYIKQICDKMRKVRWDKLGPVVILYSLSDNNYRGFP